MPDKQKVVKGLECLAQKQEQMANPCSKCDYHDRPNFAFCVVDVATDALALLKEQPEIVRCKDCRKNMMCEITLNKPKNWFCADGVKIDR